MSGGWFFFVCLALAASDLSTGLALYRKRDFAAAEQEFRRALERNVKDGPARIYLARTLIEQGRLADAMAELDRALDGNPDAETRFRAGEIARELAQRRFDDLQARAPRSPAVLELAGRQLELKGRHEEALKEYRAAAALNPQRPGIHYWIGNSLWRLRRLDEARAELETELRSNPAHAMANLRLGEVLIASGAEEQAVAPLEKAVQAMPGSLDARRELGKAYRKAGRDQDARREWEIVAKLHPGDDQIHFLLGGLYRSLGEAELAASEFKQHREILARRRDLSERK